MKRMIESSDVDPERAQRMMDDMAGSDSESTDSGEMEELGPLHEAAGMGRMDTCKYLVEDLGFDINAEANDDSGNDGLVRLLLSNGASVNASSSEGTPLHMAASHGKSAIVQILLQNNADPNRVCADLGTPMTATVLCAVVACVIPGKITESAALKCMKLLVKNKVCDKDEKAKLKSLGAKAVEEKDYAAATKFYSEAIKVDPADAALYSNRSLCHLKSGKAQDALVDANDSIRVRPDWPKGYYRKGAAFMALKEYKEACDAFMAAVKLDPENEEMHDAFCFLVDVEMVRAMDEEDRAKLADMVILAGCGLLEMASSLAQMEVCKYLVEELGFDDNLGGFRGGNEAVVCLLLFRGATVDVAGVHGTPLHTAASYGNPGALKILLDHHADAGADVNSANPDTPLMVATKYGLADCIKYLLEAGADPNIPDKEKPRNKTMDKIADLKSQGENAVKRKDYLGASKLYSEALELDNCDATLYSNRSFCYVQIGNSQKALLDADVCIARRPNWVKGYYRKGAAHMSLKEHKKAVEAFLDGLKLDPGNAEIEKVLWEALEAMKKDHAATGNLQSTD
ncbi:hypothetical protein ACQ4PT_030825 [Festuca glaucescens]